MSQTRVELERKLERLEARAQELGPWQYVKRFVPEYWLDRTIGTVLILCGLTMARKRFRRT